MNRRRTLLFGAFVSLVIFAVMALLVRGAAPWQAGATGSGSFGSEQQLDGVTDSLFGDDVIGFEVLGILLTAAMIGALVIARPMEAQTDESRYSHPTAEQVAQTDLVSDPRHAVMTGPSTPLEASK